jgi:uncharacterized protein YndB with AHSA1/START domain
VSARTRNHAAAEGTLVGDREIVMTRLLDAPRELVWQCFTEVEHLGNWWGPRGFTTTTRKRELKPGGVWSYVMHGPDGRDYENHQTYLEVAAPEKLVYKHGGDGGAAGTEPISFHVTVTFEPAGERGEQTLLTMRSTFPNSAARDHVVRTYHALEGGKQHLTRLGEYLDSLDDSSANRPFVVTRVVPAARERVWRAWTEREQLMQWFGPTGSTMPQCTLDLREGGMCHYQMRKAEGNEVWGRWVFREIAAPGKLVFVFSFSDPAGGIARASFAPNWPLETLTTVTLAEHAGISKGTVVTVQWSPLNPSEDEKQAFAGMFGSMTEGWTGTFDRLAAVLAK